MTCLPAVTVWRAGESGWDSVRPDEQHERERKRKIEKTALCYTYRQHGHTEGLVNTFNLLQLTDLSHLHSGGRTVFALLRNSFSRSLLLSYKIWRAYEGVLLQSDSASLNGVMSDASSGICGSKISTEDNLGEPQCV